MDATLVNERNGSTTAFQAGGMWLVTVTGTYAVVCGYIVSIHPAARFGVIVGGRHPSRSLGRVNHRRKTPVLYTVGWWELKWIGIHRVV